MIILKGLYRLGFVEGCRYWGRHLTKSFSAARNAVLEPQSLPGTSGTGDLQRKIGSLTSKQAWRQTTLPYPGNESHSEVLLLEHGISSCTCDNGTKQISELCEPCTSACHTNILNGEVFPKKSNLDSRHSVSINQSDECKSSSELQHRYAGRGLKFNVQEERILVSERRAHLTLVAPKVVDGSQVAECGDSKEKAPLTNQTRKQSLKRSRKVLVGKLAPSHGCVDKSILGNESLNKVKQQRRRPTNVYEFNRLISVLMEAGYRDEACAVYKQILPTGCRPDYHTYLHLIRGSWEAGKFAEAREFFGEFISKDELSRGSGAIVYNVMLHGLGAAGFVDEALKLVKDMTDRGCLPDVCTYNSLIHSLGKVGKVNEALIVFQSMAGSGCTPDVVTYNSLICSLGKAGRVMEAYELYEGMRGKGCHPDLCTFNTVLQILGKSGEIDQAFNLYSFMKSVGCQPDVYTYTSLVTNLCLAGRVDDALVLSVEMTQRGCTPNTVTFNAWLDGLCKKDRVVEAHLLFHKMLGLGYVPDRITYCILIDAFCKTGKYVDKCFQLLKELLKSTGCLDGRTSDIISQSFKKVGRLKQAKRIARNFRAKRSRSIPTGLKS